MEYFMARFVNYSLNPHTYTHIILLPFILHSNGGVRVPIPINGREIITIMMVSYHNIYIYLSYYIGIVFKLLGDTNTYQHQYVKKNIFDKTLTDLRQLYYHIKIIVNILTRAG